MKKVNGFLMCLVLFAFLGLNGFAQETREAETLLGGKLAINAQDFGFVIAPSYGLTQFDRAYASLLNVRAGVGFRDVFTAGGFASFSLNEVRPQSENISDIYMDYRVFGGFLEYTLFPKKLFHVSFPLYIGYGEVEMDNYRGDLGLGEANFFQIEPSVVLEVNLHKYVRFNLGGGYRFIGPLNYRNFDESDISGPTGYVGLKFGLFR